MVMETIQIRLSSGLIERVDKLIETGIYSNRSEVIRDSVRRLVLDNLIGIVQNKKDSVKEIKEIRNKLSKKITSHKDLDKLNKLIN